VGKSASGVYCSQLLGGQRYLVRGFHAVSIAT
jgi:hypothetical protein